MLRLSKLTDYALLIMSHLAKEPASILSATLLAEQLHLMPPTVSKILKILSDACLVVSSRGAEGGYRLAKKASEITIADIISAMEGSLAMTECCEKKGLCSIDAMCTLKGNWLKINEVIQSFLAQFTILDMVDPLFFEEKRLERLFLGLMHDK